jgi:hypothetical protein
MRKVLIVVLLSMVAVASAQQPYSVDVELVQIIKGITSLNQGEAGLALYNSPAVGIDTDDVLLMVVDANADKHVVNLTKGSLIIGSITGDCRALSSGETITIHPLAEPVVLPTGFPRRPLQQMNQRSRAGEPSLRVTVDPARVTVDPAALVNPGHD